MGEQMMTGALVFLLGIAFGGAVAGLRPALEAGAIERERAQQFSAIVAHCANGRGFTIDERTVHCKIKDSPQIHPNP